MQVRLPAPPKPKTPRRIPRPQGQELSVNTQPRPGGVQTGPQGRARDAATMAARQHVRRRVRQTPVREFMAGPGMTVSTGRARRRVRQLPRRPQSGTPTMTGTGVETHTGETEDTGVFGGMGPQRWVEAQLAPRYAQIQTAENQAMNLSRQQQSAITHFAERLGHMIAEKSDGIQGTLPPEYAAALGNMALRNALYQQFQAAQRFADERAEVAAQAPSLLAQAHAQQAEQEARTAELAFREQDARFDRRMKMRALQLQEAIAGVRATQGQQSIRLRARGEQRREREGRIRAEIQVAGLEERRRSARVRERTTVLQNDRSWRARLASLGIANARERRLAAQAESRLQGGGLTASQRQKLREKSAEFLEEAYYGVPARQSRNPETDEYENVPGTGKQALTYRQAIRGMVTRGIPYSMAVQQANQYYGPGEGGRPRRVTKKQKRQGHRVVRSRYGLPPGF